MCLETRKKSRQIRDRSRLAGRVWRMGRRKTPLAPRRGRISIRRPGARSRSRFLGLLPRPPRCREDRPAQERARESLTDGEAARRYHECTGNGPRSSSAEGPAACYFPRDLFQVEKRHRAHKALRLTRAPQGASRPRPSSIPLASYGPYADALSRSAVASIMALSCAARSSRHLPRERRCSCARRPTGRGSAADPGPEPPR